MGSEEMLSAETNADFNKARNKALVNELLHFLTPEESRMISLGDMKTLLKPDGEVYEGLKIVPLSLIVGSEGRYKDFDNHFFPKSLHLKTRWEHIDMAHINGDVLPPVMLYELGGVYFVRDGNHRVSVAKAQGVETIDAEVVSLQTQIRLKPSDTKKKMLKQVLNFEKRSFYMETHFGDITNFWCLDFSTTGMYDVIYNHILVHKYYINQTKSETVSMEDAIMSWFRTVYYPIAVTIEDQNIICRFSGRTISDLYVWIVKYWDELKKKFGDDYSIDDATHSFSTIYGKAAHTKFLRRARRAVRNYIKKLLLKLMMKAQEHYKAITRQR